MKGNYIFLLYRCNQLKIVFLVIKFKKDSLMHQRPEITFPFC